jgi:hypothetical protein
MLHCSVHARASRLANPSSDSAALGSRAELLPLLVAGSMRHMLMAIYQLL